MAIYTRQVADAQDGQRLSRFLRETLGVSYTAMKSAKWDNRILVDGVPAPVSHLLRAGERVTFREAADAPVYTLRPYALPLTIPYQDEHLLIVDKPAPLASQSSAGHPDDSLENALYAHFGCPADFVYRPVNRLDRGTSGLMAVARTPHAQQLLQRQLHTPDFQRVYLAVCEGAPPQDSGVISLPIGKADAASIRREVRPDGKPSVTRYEVLEHASRRSLLRLTLETGRTHQIRVHLSAVGCPVCGDFLYGTELAELPGRFALHSAALTLRHPLTGETLSLSSPLPPALSALLCG